MPETPPPARLSALVPAYDAIVSDVWGVVHNGERATPQACEALVRARAAGRPVLLVSNAPRPAASVAAQLDRLGVPRAAYDAILTSGDLTRAHLAADPWAWVHRVGPERDAPVYEGLDLTFVDPDEADLCVVTGLLDDETETAEDYRGLLGTLHTHEVPLVCANPDLIVERGARLIPCAGAIASLYERMGGEVIWFGKPYPAVYARALETLSGLAGRALEPGRILAIGDAVRTDLAGAARAGMASLFVAGGIHAAEAGTPEAIDRAHLDGLFRAAKVAPVGVAWHLDW